MSREYTDERIDEVLAIIRAEFVKATRKFGAFHNGHEGFAVIREEVDELWDDVKANKPDNALRESIQVAAMGMRFFYDLVRSQDIEPLKTVFGVKREEQVRRA